MCLFWFENQTAQTNPIPEIKFPHTTKKKKKKLSTWFAAKQAGQLVAEWLAVGRGTTLPATPFMPPDFFTGWNRDQALTKEKILYRGF